MEDDELKDAREIMKALDGMGIQHFESVEQVEKWASRRDGDGEKALRVHLANRLIAEGHSTDVARAWLSMVDSDRALATATTAQRWAMLAAFIALASLFVSAWPYL